MALKAHIPDLANDLDDAYDYDIAQRHGVDAHKRKKKKKSKHPMQRSMIIKEILRKAFGNKNKPQASPFANVEERRVPREAAPRPAQGSPAPVQRGRQQQNRFERSPDAVIPLPPPPSGPKVSRISRVAAGADAPSGNRLSSTPQNSQGRSNGAPDAALAHEALRHNRANERALAPRSKRHNAKTREGTMLIPKSHEEGVARTIRERRAASPEATTSALSTLRSAPSLSPGAKRFGRMRVRREQRQMAGRLARPLSGQVAAEQAGGPFQEQAPVSAETRNQPRPAVDVRPVHEQAHDAIRQWARQNPHLVRRFIRQNPERALAAFAEAGPEFAPHRCLAMLEHGKQAPQPVAGPVPRTGAPQKPKPFAGREFSPEERAQIAARTKKPRQPMLGDRADAVRHAVNRVEARDVTGDSYLRARQTNSDRQNVLRERIEGQQQRIGKKEQEIAASKPKKSKAKAKPKKEEPVQKSRVSMDKYDWKKLVASNVGKPTRGSVKAPKPRSSMDDFDAKSVEKALFYSDAFQKGY